MPGTRSGFSTFSFPLLHLYFPKQDQGEVIQVTSEVHGYIVPDPFSFILVNGFIRDSQLMAEAMEYRWQAQCFPY